jgi:hypothetical protein
MAETGVQARFDAVARALADRPGVTLGSGRSSGFGSTALQFEGRIFAMVRGEAIVLKLPRERVATLIDSGIGAAFDAGKGRPMKEWVAVDAGPDADWLALAEEALAFARR